VDVAVPSVVVQLLRLPKLIRATMWPQNGSFVHTARNSKLSSSAVLF